MALRAENSNSSSLTLSTTGLSHFFGLPVYCHEAGSTPGMDYDKCLDLFQVAVMDKYSIPITELKRRVIDQTLSVYSGIWKKTLLKKVVSVMYLSYGESARKTNTPTPLSGI